MLADEHHHIAAAIVAVLRSKTDRARGAQRRDIGHFHLLQWPIRCVFGQLASRKGTGSIAHELLADQLFASAIPLAHHRTGGGYHRGLRQADGEHFDVRRLERLCHFGNDAHSSGHTQSPNQVRTQLTVASKYEYSVDG